ncbi:hypothetical protein TNCV_1019241 [Trichonephila clavipes]|nr:hypothetical protein TNCV_1019241 [Trichonephila clavipes]
MNVLLFGCMGKDIQRGDNRIIKCSLECIKTRRNVDFSEPRLKILGGRKQHEHVLKECIAFCELKSQYQYTVPGRCNRKIWNNCPSCTAG